jgi:predicted RND superfamily exporter protein
MPMGYSLGIGESVAGVIVIGYSVDYVVHLAHMYEEAPKFGCTTRHQRASFAIENMGGTVFAGAVTTAGAGVIMFLCFSTFFHKMAILISMTIVYSFFFSLGLFTSLLFLIGPEGHSGDLAYYWNLVEAKCRGRKVGASSTESSET